MTTVAGTHYRITVLTSRLLRLEWSPESQFEDRATQIVTNRTLDQDNVEVQVDQVRGGNVRLQTEHLNLTYDGRKFSASGLSVRVLGDLSNYRSTWRYGVPPKVDYAERWRNLGGTARTLDEVDGATELTPGLVSSGGYAVLEDTSLIITEDGGFEQREPGSHDVYLFAYGHDAISCIRDFYRLSGAQPLLPRFALGNWWSRYHPYSDVEYTELLDQFDIIGVPLSVAVLDMDWHLVDIDPTLGSGWTGYTWNDDLFPDPAEFMRTVHDRGLKVSLNVHPADGIRRHEARYPDVAEACGVDPDSGMPVPFDLTDERFRRAYFELVHHPMEDEGVDFWWIDWQQGPYSSIPGLDPLWLLNHLHYRDNARTGKRPLILSRYSGPGSHRYPIGFSGDTVISWASLAFQPYFTATASNVGYGWWSHDIGGHFYGRRDNELHTRWVQLGCFSPINRLHSTRDEFMTKEPWAYPEPYAAVQAMFLRLRHRLVPYLYTMNARAHHDGRPLCEPLYWQEPNPRLAESTTFRFGSELLVAPITEPIINGAEVAPVRSHLPPGIWIDYFTGRAYDGGDSGRDISFHRPLQQYPVLGKAGGIVPMTGHSDYSIENPAALDIVIFAGANGSFELYEDDDAAVPSAARTQIDFDWDNGKLVIHPVQADGPDVAPDKREITLTVIGAAPFEAHGYEREWDDLRKRVVVPLGSVDADTGCEVTFSQLKLAANATVGRIRRLVDRAEIEFETKRRIMLAVTEAYATPGPSDSTRAISDLHELRLDPTLFAALLELIG